MVPNHIPNGRVEFNPPVVRNSTDYDRLWEIIEEMGVYNRVVIHYKGWHSISDLLFLNKDEAMMFKLRF